MPESSPTPGASLVGRVLANTYRVEGLLGKGGMGAVYAASHLRLPTKVAVKVLHAEAASNPEIFARFRREAEITSGLRHPNIVQVLDFNNLDDGTPYLIMEYLHGEDLHQRLQKRGRLSYEEVVNLLRAVGAGLMAAHKREVVHRDLKPQNIFLCRPDQNDSGDDLVEVPKIVDFGISKIRHASTDTQQTQDQQLLGTPNYMSPEQARGNNSEVDSRTDQWALAAIVYQCLTGQLAFSGTTLAGIIYSVVLSEPPPLREMCPEVPEYAEAAVRRALSKRREDRFASVLDFVRGFSGQPLVGQASHLSSRHGVTQKPGEHPAANTPGRRPTSEFPGSSLPASVSSVGAHGGRTVELPPTPFTPHGSLADARGQVNRERKPGAWRFGVAAFAIAVVLFGGGAFLYRRMTATPSPSRPFEVPVRVLEPPPDASAKVDAKPVPPDAAPLKVPGPQAGDVHYEAQQNVPRPEDRHRHDKNKPHRPRQSNDAEDVDINLGSAK